MRPIPAKPLPLYSVEAIPLLPKHPQLPTSPTTQYALGGADDQLQTADASAWQVDSGWQAVVGSFFASRQGADLLAFLQLRLNEGAAIFPPQPMRALQLTRPQDVRVVILGQDPYHGRGQAEGLAFSVAPGVRSPPSLRNILKEFERDMGSSQQQPLVGSLEPWARHGVLLLNTCLTVEEGRAASHAGKGWEVLTDAIINQLSQSEQPVVFMLWGAHAQGKRVLIDEHRHAVLTANHPSPLSASRPPRPFVGCGHFSQAVAWMAQQDARRGVKVPWATPAIPTKYEFKTT